MALAVLIMAIMNIVVGVIATIVYEKRQAPETNLLGISVIVVCSLVVTSNIVLNFGLLGAIVGLILLMTTFVRVGFNLKYIVNCSGK